MSCRTIFEKIAIHRNPEKNNNGLVLQFCYCNENLNNTFLYTHVSCRYAERFVHFWLLGRSFEIKIGRISYCYRSLNSFWSQLQSYQVKNTKTNTNQIQKYKNLVKNQGDLVLLLKKQIFEKFSYYQVCQIEAD